MKTIDLVYFNAGGGHRVRGRRPSTWRFANEDCPGRVRLVNLFEVLDPRDVFGKTTGMKPEQYYNARLARGWTLGSGPGTEGSAGADPPEPRILDCAAARALARRPSPTWSYRWCRISTAPCFRPSAAARPQAPYVTILTDFADSPPHFWIEPNQAQHLICGTAKAVAQARAAGYDDASEFIATSGMIIRSGFLP